LLSEPDAAQLYFAQAFLARLDFSGVTGDRVNDASAERAFDQRRTHFLDQNALRELREGARKTRRTEPARVIPNH
jgi:hypothetical protein